MASLSNNAGHLFSMRPSQSLVTAELFRTGVCADPRADDSYERAKAIGLANALSMDDILNMSQKFWAMHLDPIMTVEGAATTLLTIQYNLVVGTLAKFASTSRPELVQLVQDLLSWKIIGQFCLTELARGLDIFQMKTTATLLPSGEFDLHTPTDSDAKFMPPTIPVLGIPCIAIVFAQLIVDGEYRGPRPFLVELNDGYKMTQGITSKLLPYRGGSNPVNHALTDFDHVRLSHSALLGDITKSNTIHRDFMESIWRVPVGSLALSLLCIPGMQVSTFIAGRYGLRRHVQDPRGESVPIISFRTQQIPLFAAISQLFVLQALYKWSIQNFMDLSLDARARHGVAACFKAVIIQHAQAANIALSERLGAQGLFHYNRLSNFYSEARGISIAEGDILGLSMRLVADTLAQKYAVPPSSQPDSLLARHETGLFEEAIEVVSSSSDYISAFMRFVQPLSQQMVEAIGHRMAYDAAVAEGVPQCLINLYVTSVIKMDTAWYVERGLLKRQTVMEMEDKALTEAVPRLEEFLAASNIEPYVSAPIISDERWAKFSETLPVYTGMVKTRL